MLLYVAAVYHLWLACLQVKHQDYMIHVLSTSLSLLTSHLLCEGVNSNRSVCIFTGSHKSLTMAV
jgi:hypothetical protein